ncbi:MAG: DUF2807 domain-containing protein [Terricaulis sp.]
MERAVFYVAIVVAVFVAIGAMFGGGVIHFNGADAIGFDPVVQATAGHTGPQGYQAASIEVRNTAARITVTAEDRQDVLVEITNPGGAPTPVVTLSNGILVVDGRLRGRIDGCGGENVHLRGYGDFADSALPQIVLHTPRTLDIDVDGANFTQISDADAVDADLSGCGDTTIGAVTGALNVDFSGSGTVRAGSASRVSLDLSGSGEAHFGAVSESAEVSIAGSGEATFASLTGSFDGDSAGSGRVSIEGGSITTADIEVAGSGRTRIAAPVQRLSVEIAGSGAVDVTAPVGDVDAEIAGSGEVRVQSVSGAVRQEVYGSGRFEVGQ